MKTICIMGLALAGAFASSANTFLPSGNGEVWSESSNWSESAVPNAAGAQAEIGIPTKFKKNKGWRNIHVDMQVAVGSLDVTCGGCTNRLDTGDTGGDLIFDGGAGAASFAVTDAAGAGLAMIDLDAPYSVRLATDATFSVSNVVGDAEYGGILLKGLIAGNGHNLKKSGEGVMTLEMANADGAQPIDKLQIEAGTVAILKPLTVGSITKDGACRVLMSAKLSSEVLASSVVCTSKMSVDNPCLFIPTSTGDETYYGGFVSPDLKKVSKCKAYVLSDAGEVLFDGRRWTICENVELSIEDLSEGYKTYKAVVPALGGEPPAVSVAIQFNTSAPALGKAIETTLAGMLPSPEYRWVSWPACEDAAAGVEVGTDSSYVPTEDDLEHWLQVQVWQDSELVCSNKLYFSRLPVVYLTTDDGMAVTNKEYIAASLKIQGNSEFKQQYDGPTQVKGRGHSSWGLYPQKSYKLKLDKKTDLFGFGKNKHWVLATSFHDRAFMRNKSASELAKALGLIGMDMTWVDVIYNGEYYGVYMLSEHLRVDEKRVDIFDWDDEAESVAGALFKLIKDAAALTDDDLSALETQMDEDLSWMSSGRVVFKGQTYDLADYGLRKDYDFSGGYLFEVDHFTKEGITRFMTKGGVNVHVETPEFLRSNAEMFNVVTSLWARFEAAYKSPDGRCADGVRYTQIADLDSMVAFWLVNELMGQGDPHNSRFSYIDQGGKLTYGPVWDYDHSSAAGVLPKLGRYFATLNYDGKDNWFRDWVQHQDFRTRAIELYWQVARPKMMELVDSPTFDERNALLYEAGAAEDARWGMFPNPFHSEMSMPTHAEDVENWRYYILDHIKSLDAQFSSEKSFAQCLKEIYPGCSVVAYDLADGTTPSELQTIVSPNAWFNVTRPQRSGFVFAGWTVSGDVSTKAQYSVQRNVSSPMTSATLCGAESNYCAFRGLAEPGGVVCLRANWTIPGGYAIEYDLAGGITEEDFPISVAADGWLELPAPHRNGYVFAGWSLEGEIPADALFAVPGFDPLELYGSYIYGGGFESCRFYGLAEAGGFVRLKAHWSIPGGYAVEYDLDGGTAGSAYQDAIACNGWLYLKTPVKEGYEFAGWSLVGDILDSGRYSIQSGVSWLLDPEAVSYGGGYGYCSFYGLAEECGAVLLRAHWTVPGGYAVEYDLAGGTAGSSYQNSIACNGWLYLKTPVKEGFEFVGWSLVGAIPGSARYSTQSGVSQKIVSTAVPYGGGHGYCSFRGLTEEQGTVVLRANWAVPGGYAIEYDLAGGVAGDAYPVSVVANGWMELAAPHRNGYVFAGWSLEGEILDDALFAIPGSDAFELNGTYTCGGGFESCRFSGLAKVGGFVRLKAHWAIPGGYAVEYDLDGGKAGSAYQDTIAHKGWLYLKTPVKEGFEFAGWSIVGDISGIARYSTQSGVSQLLNPAAVSYGGGHDYCSFFALAEERGAVVLRAHWTVPGGYAVEYDLGGGKTGSSYRDSIACNGWLYLKTPVKDGYEFVGWSLTGDISSTARYSTQSCVSHLLPSTNMTYGGGYEYCSFRGLVAANSTALLRANWVVKIVKSVKYGKTLKLAVEEKQKTIFGAYAVDYDLAGGIADDDYPTLVAEDDWFELPAPRRDGYEFVGWTLEGEVSSDAMFTDSGCDVFMLYDALIYGGGFESCWFCALAEAGSIIRLKANWVISADDDSGGDYGL